MQGLHLTADLHDCAAHPALLTDAGLLARTCLSLVEQAGLSAVAERFHAFAGAGVTGMVLLAESHLAVHTWPEFNAVTLDVYVCNYSRDNSTRALALLDALIATFEPRRQSLKRLERGHLNCSDRPR